MYKILLFNLKKGIDKGRLAFIPADSLRASFGLLALLSNFVLILTHHATNF